MPQQEASIIYINSIRELLELIDSRIREYGDVSYEQFYILYLLTNDKQLTSKEIAKITRVSSPAISHKLNTLMKKGLIRKIYGKSKDQREVQIQVTKKGNIVTENVINRYTENLNNNVDVSELALEVKRIKDFMSELFKFQKAF